MKEDNQNVFGIFGLGTMGRNLLLNISDKGFAVAGYNRHKDKVDLLMTERTSDSVQGFINLPAFVAALNRLKLSCCW